MVFKGIDTTDWKCEGEVPSAGQVQPETGCSHCGKGAADGVEILKCVTCGKTTCADCAMTHLRVEHGESVTDEPQEHGSHRERLIAALQGELEHKQQMLKNFKLSTGHAIEMFEAEVQRLQSAISSFDES